MSKSLLHDWESSIEKNKNNTEELLKIAEDIYNTAYARGKASTERPQGKWIKIFENPFTNGYVCPFCNHKIQVTEQFLPQVTECESCGADMRGGAE